MTQDIPLRRLEYFRNEIGLDEAKMAALRPYAPELARRARKAGKYLDALMRKVAPRARLELTVDFDEGAYGKFWTHWYSTVWERPWDNAFLRELWTQGFNAARGGVDLQYVMLGEIKCRQLFIKTVRETVPQGQRSQVSSAVNILLDLCMMVRAKGHASYLAQCSEPLLQGIFHQTRNPLTVIGGTAMRIMRSGSQDVRGLAQVILDEALRLERMTRDISTFNSVENAEPVFETIALAPLLEQILEGLRSGPNWPQGLAPSVELDPAHPEVEADPSLAREIFSQVLVNALEACTASGGGTLSLSSRLDAASGSHLDILVRNTGELPRGQDVEHLFLPFNSSKPMGTGFGLAIARAAARKCFGQVRLAQAGDQVVCVVKLPLKGCIDEAGLPDGRGK